MLKCCESHGEVINTLILVTIYLSCLYVAWFVGESPKKIFIFKINSPYDVPINENRSAESSMAIGEDYRAWNSKAQHTPSSR